MTSNRAGPRSVATAMLCAGVVTAQYVVGKATRDALFFAQFDFTALPTMFICTSFVSISLVMANSRAAGRLVPRTLVSGFFAVSGALFIAEWLLIGRIPRAVAVGLYLHISGAGPLLGSGFWLIASERFDPRTAKRRFGQIAGVGTLGGLVGGMLAERLGTVLGLAAVLPFLAAINLLCAWLVRGLAGPQPKTPIVESAPVRSGLRVLAEAPYLRNLAALTLIVTTGAGLADFVFKATITEALGRGESLLRFFALYYATTGLVTFAVQASSSRFMLERYGLAVVAGTPSTALVIGGASGLLMPGLASVLAMRAGEAITRGSLYRAGYELFFTPIPPAEKRAVKSVIDVGFDRLGDAVAGGILRLVLLGVAPAVRSPVILLLMMTCAGVAIAFASRLNRGYIDALEKGLLQRAVDLDLADVEDLTTRTAMLRTIGRTHTELEAAVIEREQRVVREGTAATSFDPEVQAIVTLRSRDAAEVTKLLRSERGISPGLVPHVIPLLAWNPVAEAAIFALRKVAEERVGELIDALLDPNQDFAVRRRLARVFAVCVSQRAADGLMLGLDDLRFEVRFQCARSLAAIVEKNLMVQIDKERIFAHVLREVAVGRPVWESRRLLDTLDATETVPFVDEFVRDRASQSLTHVFTLLALVLPREPLQIAFRGLHTDDQNLRGTALEYLEGILPPAIRDRLWPFLEDRRASDRRGRPRDEILADLLRSNRSIVINLQELQRQVDGGRVGASEPASNPVAPVDSRM
jgi:ATP:ADP antiporter, AAA family